MLLRKLEVYGFKSFADRSEIEFGPGITTIVGPNGSGKSNVSDAIRWALGEQSIRTLRGTKTEDVIFAGSSKRRPLGAAEVSLIFDNSDGLLPLDYSEVTITRRAFRTGESEYYINKTQCRLKDIHDLLADTGLGRDSMTVIGQNKIDELLNAKPEERRLMFEEAAGITKYKYRKREALRKLEDTQQNITRVQDLTGEIENQLSPLAESAERTAEYNQLREQLISCQATLLLDKLEYSEKMLESADLEQAALSESEMLASARLSVIETERERQTIELNQLDQDLNNTIAEINQIATELERSDGRIALFQEKIAQGQRDLERINKELYNLKNEQTQASSKLAEIKELHSTKEAAANESAACLEQLLGQDKEISERILQIEAQIQSGNDHNFDHIQQLVTERNNHRTAERDLTAQKARADNLEKEKQLFLKEMTAAFQQTEQVEADGRSLQAAISSIVAALETGANSKRNIQQDLARITTQEKLLVTEIEGLSSRVTVLTAMQEEYEGYGRGTKSVLKNNFPWNKGVCGAVGQLLTVEDQYLTAVEIALGGALQHVITDTDEIAKQAINFLKAQKLGRTTFLPLNTIKPQKPRENELAASKTNGAIGFASELVRCDPKYRSIIEYLLGRTIVAKNIEDALRIAKQFSHSVKIVTLEGELLNPGGSITGGSTGRRDASILGRQNEIENLHSQLLIKRKEHEGIQINLAEIRAELSCAENHLDQLSSQKHAAEIKLAEVSLRREKLQADAERLDFSLKTINAEIEISNQEETHLLHKIKAALDLISLLESQDTHFKQNLDILQNTFREIKSQKEDLSSLITEERIRLSTCKQELNSITAEINRLIQEELAKADYFKKIHEEQQAITVLGQQLHRQHAEETSARQDTVCVKEKLEQKRQSCYDEKLGVMAEMQKTDREAKDLRRKVQTMQAKLHEMQLMSAKYEYELTYCLEQLNERYELTREQAQTVRRSEKTEELNQLIYALETHITQLGPVNPAAIEEYSRLKERYDFLQVQLGDLITAKEYLASIVADIDNTMSKQFKAAFAMISQYFQDTFIRLFGGGQASIHMLEPENVLESGIEIFVQPPGKKQQNLALLSGGERALTVIALLFAFLTYRPAPFSVVDEIDAALDEANVQRFSEFLSDFARNTQFIVVTHRKGTMEAADVMIGITMEESGVSRLLSVKFMEKAG